MQLIGTHHATLALSFSLSLQRSNPAYKAFLEGKPVPLETNAHPSSTCEPHRPPAVVGTWDDHDFGINDGGGGGSLTKYGVTDATERQRLFHDFLDTPADSPLRRRGGVYASHQYGPPGRQVKIILLDTRGRRALHAIPSVGSVSKYVPVVGGIFGMLGAFSRAAAAWLGLSNGGSNTLLDAEQWRWLEAQLANSSAQAHIIVSSIQVLTSNPLVESWGHFPAERQRLLDLLNKTSPLGLLLLSGDVHMGEFMSGSASSEVLEVTSSGLTHTCSGGLVPGFVCSAVVRMFGAARYTGGPAYYSGRNFATVDFGWPRLGSLDAGCAPAITVRVRDADTGKTVLTYERPACVVDLQMQAPIVVLGGGAACFVRTLLVLGVAGVFLGIRRWRAAKAGRSRRSRQKGSH